MENSNLLDKIIKEYQEDAIVLFILFVIPYIILILEAIVLYLQKEMM